MSVQLDKLTASVTAENAKIDSVIAQLTSTASTLAAVSAQLAALQASGSAPTPEDLSAVQALVDGESAKIDAVLNPAPPVVPAS